MMQRTATARATGAAAPPTDPDDADAAYTRALRSLNAASQSRASLTRRLARAGFGAAAVDAACARLLELGYLDDDALAGATAQRRLQQGRGASLIAAELRQKGIGQESVDAALAGIDDESLLEHATATCARLLRRRAALAPHVRDRQVLGALTRRGFSFRVARLALEAASRGPAPEL
jgi:regulatory protein